jgi:hypothetical protein
MTKLQEFTDFLKTVDLDGYRARYLHIKIVEMDLPREVQSIALLYQVYWTEKTFIDFDAFYRRYSTEKSSILEKFRKQTGLCKDCFYKGLPARTYRTWASLITQIHAGYVAESVFGDGTVAMSEELDHHGVDFQVKYKNVITNFQIKKETQSREVRKEKKSKKAIEGQFIYLNYKVPNYNVIKNPKKQNGEYRKPYLEFKSRQDLDILPNGFVIFTRKPFEERKAEIDAESK